MKTKTAIRKERRANTMHNALGMAIPRKPRNVGVSRTIQDLKADHKAAGGTFFDQHTVTHGHPVNGLFILSTKAGGSRQYFIRRLEGAKVPVVAGPFLTHAGAMNAMK